MQSKTGKCIIVSAPSGAGKTTIVRSLLAQGLRLTFSVSATNRSKRSFEVDGKDYFFISMEEFQEKVEQDAFIEWEEVYPGMVYGTLKSEIERIWAQGNIAIFVSPPSIEELEARLRKRDTESIETLKKRIDKAAHEMTFADQFDAIIVNDTLEHACDEAYDLVKKFIG